MWYKDYLRAINIEFDVKETKIDFNLISEIITNHQIYIPFDSVKKVQDYYSGKSIVQLYSEPADYINSVIRDGLGGTCFHLTWGMYSLLKSLNLNVCILRLDYQHYALSILYDQNRYYIDVSFWSPLFSPMPLTENWIVQVNDQKVEWEYSNEKAVLYWNGYPAKEWNGEIIDENEFFKDWENSMIPSNYFMSNLYFNKWKDSNTFLFLTNNKYTEYFNGRVIKETKINSFDFLSEIIMEKFGHYKSSEELREMYPQIL